MGGDRLALNYQSLSIVLILSAQFTPFCQDIARFNACILIKQKMLWLVNLVFNTIDLKKIAWEIVLKQLMTLMVVERCCSPKRFTWCYRFSV